MHIYTRIDNQGFFFVMHSPLYHFLVLCFYFQVQFLVNLMESFVPQISLLLLYIMSSYYKYIFLYIHSIQNSMEFSYINDRCLAVFCVVFFFKILFFSFASQFLFSSSPSSHWRFSSSSSLAMYACIESFIIQTVSYCSWSPRFTHIQRQATYIVLLAALILLYLFIVIIIFVCKSKQKDNLTRKKEKKSSNQTKT